MYCNKQAARHAMQMLSCHNAASKHTIASSDIQDICLQKCGKDCSFNRHNNAILSIQYVILSEVLCYKQQVSHLSIQR